MATPFTNASQTTETQLYIEWTPLSTAAETGGSSINSYWLQWDKGSNGGTWYDVIGNGPQSLDTNILLTSEVVPGTIYWFRVKAYNIHGWGEWSTIAYIKAANKASQMTAVTT